MTRRRSGRPSSAPPWSARLVGDGRRRRRPPSPALGQGRAWPPRRRRSARGGWRAAARRRARSRAATRTRWTGCDWAGRPATASGGPGPPRGGTRRRPATTDPATTASRWTTDSGPHVHADEHQRRPVPQVDGVGALADPQHRRGAEDVRARRPAPRRCCRRRSRAPSRTPGAAAAYPGKVVPASKTHGGDDHDEQPGRPPSARRSGGAGCAAWRWRSPAARRSAAPTPVTAASRTPTACCCR